MAKPKSMLAEAQVAFLATKNAHMSATRIRNELLQAAASQGLTAEQIAHTANMKTVEVEKIIKLK